MPGEHSWKEILHLSRKDRIGLGSIALLTIAVILAPDLRNASTPPIPSDDSAWSAAWAMALEARSDSQERNYTNERRAREPKKTVEYFYFDPNTLDAAGWEKLGLRPKAIQTILNYRAKGGRFRQAADLEKIYGLFPDEKDRLKPWVRIASAPEAEAQPANSARWDSTHNPPFVRRPEPKPIDINQADSAAWESLPGIGPKLAVRVLRFREALGGFVSVSQVAETFGLADSVFKKIEPLLFVANPGPTQLLINLAGEEELSKHPYIRQSLARRLVAYRNQHGPFSSEADLMKMAGITENQVMQLRPYLNFRKSAQ